MQPPGDVDGLLERLYAMIGARDADFVADLLRDFLAELPVVLQTLTDAQNTEDWDAVRHTAHRLRSGAHALGGVGVAAASVPLEAAARAGEGDRVPILLAALHAEAEVYAQDATRVLHRLQQTPS